MTDLTLQEKKQLLLDAIQTVDQITTDVKENTPFTDTEEQWEAKQYKSFLISKLGTIEYELENKEESSTTQTETETEEETNTEQVTQQETNNNTEQNKDKKEEEEVKP